MNTKQAGGTVAQLDIDRPITIRFNRFNLPLDLDMEDTRRTTPLRLNYDFDRGGWVILKERELIFDPGNDVCEIAQTGEWIEVAFIDEDVTVQAATFDEVEAQRERNGQLCMTFLTLECYPLMMVRMGGRWRTTPRHVDAARPDTSSGVAPYVSRATNPMKSFRRRQLPVPARLRSSHQAETTSILESRRRQAQAPYVRLHHVVVALLVALPFDDLLDVTRWWCVQVEQKEKHAPFIHVVGALQPVNVSIAVQADCFAPLDEMAPALRARCPGRNVSFDLSDNPRTYQPKKPELWRRNRCELIFRRLTKADLACHFLASVADS